MGIAGGCHNVAVPSLSSVTVWRREQGATMQASGGGEEDTTMTSLTCVEDTTYPPSLMHSLNRLRQCEQMCDVELVAEGRTIVAHRVVLAASIPYFNAMFTLGMRECNERTINISDISASALDQLVTYAYTAKLTITAENVEQLLFASSILQMESVSIHCQRYMSKWLDTSNCITLRQFAEQYNCKSLLHSTDDFATDNFLAIRSAELFPSITFQHLRDLISRSDLNVDSEEQVFECVMEWIGASVERKVHLTELLSRVRLPQLSPMYLKEVVMEHPLIKSNAECLQQVTFAALSHAQMGMKTMRDKCTASSSSSTRMNEETGGEYSAVTRPTSMDQSQSSSFISAASSSSASWLDTSRLRPLSPSGERIWPRKSVAGAIFCVGGRGTEGDPFRTVEVYDWRKNEWFSISELTTRRRHVGVVSAHAKLYAIGGHDGHNHLASAECFDPVTKAWKTLSPMSTPRRGIAVGALNNAIYAVGGLDDAACFRTVERYNIEADEWTSVEKMNVQRGGVGVAALGQVLYAVGGNDGTSSLDSCEMYDAVLDKWKLVASMANRRAGAGVCVLEGRLYAIGGFDDNAPLKTCERYDAERNEWTRLSDMSSARGGVGVAAMGGMVYAIGGHDGTKYLDSVEAYDPLLNVWQPVASIKECRAGAGVAWADVRMSDVHTKMDGAYTPNEYV